MKRKRFTALKVTLTAMMLTAALTFGAGSAYAADLPQDGGSEPTVTITPSRIVMSMTHNRKRALASFRISLSHLVTAEEIEDFQKIFDESYRFFKEVK